MITASDANPAAGAASASAVNDAYRYCAALARSHYENFNVGGCITPRDQLPHLYAIYAWCRMVDDLGDAAMPAGHPRTPSVPGAPDAAVTAHRRARLDWWESELHAIYHGRPAHPVALAVQHTVARFDIPRAPFDRLIHANRIDQGSGRFPTPDAVLDYCQYSANPVGRLFLYLFGYRDPERQQLADCTCTALQLANFWQDVARDYRERGRIYLPQSDLARFGVSEAELAAGPAGPRFRALLRHECDLAADLFRQGAPLVSMLDGPARLPVALFTKGGMAVLDAIRRLDYDVLSRRPVLSRRRKAWLLASAWFGSKVGLGYGLPDR